MKIQKTEVMNFEGAFRGLRNPLESWEKSDSGINYQLLLEQLSYNKSPCIWSRNFNNYYFTLGPKDLDLAQRMIKAGTSDRKFMRQIFVSVDITAPLYWWKEFDTYKVSTVANSTSTMHKLASTPITFDCFEMDDFENLRVYDNEPYNTDTFITDIWDDIIGYCETLRLRYNETKDKRYWKELIRVLPEAWLQTRTVTLNYEVLRNIYFQRRYHKLTEWHRFCEWIESLPYGKELITYEG